MNRLSMIDHKKLLIKYITHIAATEGIDFATDCTMTPCSMNNEKFSREELKELRENIFPTVVESFQN